VPLRQAVSDGVFAAPRHEPVQRLAELTEVLGHDVHVQTDYGDELGGRTPWELFDETDARQALAMAEEAVRLAGALIQEVTR